MNKDMELDLSCPCPCALKFPNNTERIEDGKFVYLPHKIGNCILVYGRRSTHFPFQLFVGPEWYCMISTFALIIVPTVFFMKNVAIQWGPAVVLIGTLTLIATLATFSFTALSDPGIIFDKLPSDDVESANLIDCNHCNCKRPSTASHCYMCNLCVEDLDHHCPWTGKCIGKKTIKSFFMFLWALSIHIAYVILVVIISVATSKKVI